MGGEGHVDPVSRRDVWEDETYHDVYLTVVRRLKLEPVKLGEEGSIILGREGAVGVEELGRTVGLRDEGTEGRRGLCTPNVVVKSRCT